MLEEERGSALVLGGDEALVWVVVVVVLLLWLLDELFWVSPYAAGSSRHLFKYFS